MAKGVAVEVRNLKQTVKGLKEIEGAMDEMKAVHKRIGNLVLASARRRMPSVSGKLYGSYKAANIQSGAKISSSLVYAGVSEYGGSIPRYHSKAKTLHKPKAPHSSYYIYPAIDENEMHIRDTYYDEIERLRKKYLTEV